MLERCGAVWLQGSLPGLIRSLQMVPCRSHGGPGDGENMGNGEMGTDGRQGSGGRVILGSGILSNDGDCGADNSNTMQSTRRLACGRRLSCTTERLAGGQWLIEVADIHSPESQVSSQPFITEADHCVLGLS